MAVMDEFREERKALKNASFKTKWQYFLDYYKWHVIGGAAALFFIISMIYSGLTAKDAALSGYFLNTYASDLFSNSLTGNFAEAAGIDLNEYDVLLDTSLQFSVGTLDEATMSTQQKLMVTMAAQETDFIAANEEAFLQYATTDTFHDLRTIYTEEELEKFADYIYYVDMDVVREKAELIDSGKIDDLDFEYVDPVYDHFAPEEMGDPVPIGLCIEDCPIFEDTLYFQTGSIPLGFVVNSLRTDTAKVFVDYIFEGLME